MGIQVGLFRAAGTGFGCSAGDVMMGVKVLSKKQGIDAVLLLGLNEYLA